MSGKFIVLEGPDGCGKTTQCERLLAALLAEGKDAMLTHENTSGPAGQLITQLLTEHRVMGPAAMQLLYTADRADHVETVIKPALAAGKTVISSRYRHSSIVYARALGIDHRWIQRANEPFPMPNITIVLLPPLEICLELIRKRKSADAYEKAADLQERVHAAYRELAAEDPTMVILDSWGSIDEIAVRIRTLVG